MGSTFSLPTNVVKSWWSSTSCADVDGEWIETTQAHIFHVAVPGLKKEDYVKVEVEESGRLLNVSGDVWKKGGKFIRKIRVPGNVNAGVGQVNVVADKGFVTVVIPKVEEV